MPYKNVKYDLPTFGATGNSELDSALESWRQQASMQNQEVEAGRERMPYTITTFTNDTFNLGGSPNAYISKKVQLLGGEQVTIFGYFDFRVVGRSNSTQPNQNSGDTAVGTLRVTFPSGSTVRLNARAAKLGVEIEADATSDDGVKTTVSYSATVGFTWPIEARFQDGGEHTFTLMTSGSGSVNGGAMSVQVM